LTKSNGSAVNTYFGYNTFGWVNATDTVANPFRFTGREWDSETNLYYYRARYYDPLWGRFLSEDPIRFGGGVDFYPYARNNPVTRVDPTGLIHQAWNEPPYDGRLHDDTSGLEVLCTNPRTLARDIGWLVHSIAVRSVEIASLGKNADLGHAIRLEEEIATLARCNECRDQDKKPDQEHEPTWEGVKDSAKKLVNKVADYCSQHPAVCIGVGISLGPVLFPPPVPVPE
jgi:RHS repeat-associated protein